MKKLGSLRVDLPAAEGYHQLKCKNHLIGMLPSATVDSAVVDRKVAEYRERLYAMHSSQGGDSE